MIESIIFGILTALIIFAGYIVHKIAIFEVDIKFLKSEIERLNETNKTKC